MAQLIETELDPGSGLAGLHALFLIIRLNARRVPQAFSPLNQRRSSSGSSLNKLRKITCSGVKRYSPSLIFFLHPHLFARFSGFSSHQTHFLQFSFSFTSPPSGNSPTWPTHCPASMTFFAQALKPSLSPINAHPSPISSKNTPSTAQTCSSSTSPSAQLCFSAKNSSARAKSLAQRVNVGVESVLASCSRLSSDEVESAGGKVHDGQSHSNP